MTMNIEINTAACTGLGVCESYAPDHFEVDDDGSVLLLPEPVTEADLVTVRAAIDGCPNRALRLIDG